MSGFINTILTRIQWRVLFTTAIFLLLALIISNWLQIKEVKQEHLKFLHAKAEIISSHVITGMLAGGEGDKDMEMGTKEQEQRVEKTDKDERGIKKASHLVRLHGLDHVVGDLKDMTEKNPEFSKIEIFDRKGIIIASTRSGASEEVSIPQRILNDALKAISVFTVPYKENIEIIIPIAFKGQEGHHFLKITSPKGLLKAKVFKRWVDTLWVLGLSLVFYLSFTFFYLKRELLNPITTLKDYAAQVAKGDISHDVDVKSRSEIGDISRAFNDAVHGMKAIIFQSKEVLNNVLIATKEIAKDSEQVKDGSKSQADTLLAASQSVEKLHQNIKDISTNLQGLSSMSRETSSSILEMTSSIKEVDDSVESLSINVEETTASIEEIATSFKEVVQRVLGLSRMADDAVSSISQIDSSIKEIEERASMNAELSEEVSLEGDKGVKSIEQTHKGMEKIKEAVQSISHIIEVLGTRAGEIGKVLVVVDEVAEETNLLALNAAILAAQAGKYGKGFGVVAEEIRELAERTASSTKEINNLIKGVQYQTEKAISSVREGIERVEEGERLSFKTIETFRHVLERFKDSHDMSLQIAGATEEQAKGTRLVTESIGKVTDTIHQLALAIQEQAQGSQMIIKNTEKMKELTYEIKRATGEQTAGSKVIASNTEKVTTSVNNISINVGYQKESSQQIVEAISTNMSFVEANQKNTERLIRIVMELKEDIDTLNEQMGRFVIV